MVDVVAQTDDVLGECPVHDIEDGSLRWVDIGRSLWHRLDLATRQVTTHVVEPALTAFAPTDHGDYVGAFTSGIAGLSRDGVRSSWLSQPEAQMTDNRFNDGATDPMGRFVAGSMNMKTSDPTGSLYSFSDGKLSTLRQGMNIANTIAFSPDGSVIYSADSGKNELAAFSYDLVSGRMGERIETFRPDPSLPGVPDGSAVDVEGCLWNARWGGGCIVRLAPSGATKQIISLPVRFPTSCCFVGSTLFVTTSTWDFSESDFRSEPLAGSLLAIDVGVAGLPKTPFKIASQ